MKGFLPDTTRVLRELEWSTLSLTHGISVAALSRVLGIPQPSVRRILSELRSQGHRVRRDGKRVWVGTD